MGRAEKCTSVRTVLIELAQQVVEEGVVKRCVAACRAKRHRRSSGSAVITRRRIRVAAGHDLVEGSKGIERCGRRRAIRCAAAGHVGLQALAQLDSLAFCTEAASLARLLQFTVAHTVDVERFGTHPCDGGAAQKLLRRRAVIARRRECPRTRRGTRDNDETNPHLYSDL